MTVALFKYKLADPGSWIQGQRPVAQVHDLQDLVVRDARMHETCGNMDRQTESREPASAFKAAGDIVGKGDLFLRDPQDHLAGFDNDIAAILDVNSFGYILKMRIVPDMVDL